MRKRIVTGLLSFVILIAFGIVSLFTLFGLRTCLVLGNSMRPTIPNYSFVVLGPVRTVEIRQIVVFKQTCRNKEPELIIHRIIGMQAGKFVTKGDGEENEDLLLIPEKDIEYVYLFRIQFLRFR